MLGVSGRWDKRVMVIGVAVTLIACGGQRKTGDGEQQVMEHTGGEVLIDGSSTVYPITECVAELYSEDYKGVRVKVAISGTGGGFKKFIRGEIHINNASRRIKESEAQQARENGIEWLEFVVAYDGITVAVNPQNNWVDYLTVEELRKIWAPESQGKVKKWSDVRPTWPSRPLNLYGPGTASGTFDFFTEAILGESGKSRGDYTASEDDNVLVQGVAGDPNALGYFGFAYYLENKDKLRAVPIDAGTGEGAVEPDPFTISSGKYKPLSRSLFIYVRKDALRDSVVRSFVRYYLEHMEGCAQDVGYVPVSDSLVEVQRQILERTIAEMDGAS